MAILDIIILVLFIPAIVNGISHGFISQIVGLVSLIAGARLALTFAEALSKYLADKIVVSGAVLYILSFAIIVGLTAIVLHIIASLVTKTLDILSLGWINKLMGVLFGLVNTALLIGLLLGFFLKINEQHFNLDTKFITDSQIYPSIKSLCNIAFPYLKTLLGQL